MSKTLKRTVVGIVGVACIAMPAAAVSYTKADKLRARMTGGGNVYGSSTTGTVKVTHGFSLYCNPATKPQQLQVNWSGGNSFHLTDLRTAECAEHREIDQENPDAPIDTYRGTGNGRINFGSGRKEEGRADWKFVDGGEPGGGKDLIRITVFDSTGKAVMNVSTKPLREGNHQAHRGTGSKG